MNFTNWTIYLKISNFLSQVVKFISNYTHSFFLTLYWVADQNPVVDGVYFHTQNYACAYWFLYSNKTLLHTIRYQ